jgi:hypothetical protein
MARASSSRMHRFHESARRALEFALLCAAALTLAAAAPKSPAVEAFNKAVDTYVELKDGIQSQVPPLKETDTPQQIADRERLLGSRIRQARAGAKEGELLGTARQLFTTTIRAYWKQRSAVERTELLRELPDVKRPQVNDIYPTSYPLLTFPPSLLESLPELPDGLEYRLLGPHLIIRDVKANLIVDVLSNVLPGVRATGGKS